MELGKRVQVNFFVYSFLHHILLNFWELVICYIFKTYVVRMLMNLTLLF